MILIKLGGNSAQFDFSFQKIKLEMGLVTILGFVCYLTSFVLWIAILKRFDLNWIVPLTTGIVQILTLISAVLIFKETLSFFRVIGVVVIVIGLILLNVQK